MRHLQGTRTKGYPLMKGTPTPKNPQPQFVVTDHGTVRIITTR
jgi:hypothetical protein